MRFILSSAMVAWFLLLQGKRSLENAATDNIGLFFSIYVFAFPLASLLQDRDKKKVLKTFAGAYMAAAVVLSVYGLLLILDCLPEFLVESVFWNGGRLQLIWHPNVAACFLMIGIVFDTAFLAEEKSAWTKMVLSVLLVLMSCMLALTSCRTANILTGGYLGSLIFFRNDPA